MKVSPLLLIPSLTVSPFILHCILSGSEYYPRRTPIRVTLYILISNTNIYWTFGPICTSVACFTFPLGCLQCRRVTVTDPRLTSPPIPLHTELLHSSASREYPLCPVQGTRHRGPYLVTSLELFMSPLFLNLAYLINLSSHFLILWYCLNSFFSVHIPVIPILFIFYWIPLILNYFSSCSIQTL